MVTVIEISYNFWSRDLTGAKVKVQKGNLGWKWMVYDKLDERGKAAVDEFRNRNRDEK
jgi:hypothetical protein